MKIFALLQNKILRGLLMNKYKKLFGSSFGKAIIVLTSGSILAQAITILASPLLTRIFSPQELGVYALILTAGSLFGSVVCGRYDVSIVSEKDDEKIYPLIKLAFIICVFFSAIASIGYGSYCFFRTDEYKEYAYAIGFIYILLIANGLIRILESYNNRYKEYKLMTSVYVLRTSIQNFGAVLLGYMKFGVLGLIISQTLGLLFGLKRQSMTLRPHLKEVINADKSAMKTVMKNHYRQPVYSAPAVFASSFSYSSITLFVEALFGLTALGYYSISYKVLGLPLSVMSNNVAKIFFQEASREYDKTGKFINTFRKTSVCLTAIAIPMVFCMYFLAPIAFEIVFGNGWREAGIYVKILAPMFGIRFVVNTVAYGLQVAKKQNIELILQIVFVIASVLCYIFSKVKGLCIEKYLISISITFSIIYIIYFCYVMRCAYGTKIR